MKRSVCAIGQRLRISSQIGNGSLIQRASRWSKSVAQSLTGGRSLIAPSLLDDLDRELWAVGFGKIGFFLQFRGDQAVIDLVRIAEFIELEQLRCDRLAAIVPLAFVPVDANLQRCAIGHNPVLPRLNLGESTSSLAHAGGRGKNPSPGCAWAWACQTGASSMRGWPSTTELF